MPACLSACQQSDNNVKVDDVEGVNIRLVCWCVGVQSSLSVACLHACLPRQCEPCSTPPTHTQHVGHWHQHEPHRINTKQVVSNASDLHSHQSSGNEKKLATSVNYAKINNFMLRIVWSRFGRFFFAVTSYSCRVNTMVFVKLLQVRKVNFLSR